MQIGQPVHDDARQTVWPKWGPNMTNDPIILMEGPCMKSQASLSTILLEEESASMDVVKLTKLSY
jgi:hypothetical protein